MEVVRAWVAGTELSGLHEVASPTAKPIQEQSAQRLGLDLRVWRLFTDAIALNTTAELRPLSAGNGACVVDPCW